MNVTYVENGDLALCGGYKFRRDKDTGYYLSTSRTDAGRRERLHVFVWRRVHGEIPSGMHIHHIDGDKTHNTPDNLAMMSRNEHEQLHGATMSEERRQWCRDNLAQKARPKASEWHGSAAGREWHKIHGREVMENREEKPIVCEICGKTFMSKRWDSRRCSNACRAAARRKSGLDDIERICPLCGTAFTSNKYSGAKFCSRSCARKAMWAKRREATQ